MVSALLHSNWRNAFFAFFWWFLAARRFEAQHALLSSAIAWRVERGARIGQFRARNEIALERIPRLAFRRQTELLPADKALKISVLEPGARSWLPLRHVPISFFKMLLFLFLFLFFSFFKKGRPPQLAQLGVKRRVPRCLLALPKEQAPSCRSWSELMRKGKEEGSR